MAISRFIHYNRMGHESISEEKKMPTILHVDRSRFFQKIINELAVQKSYTYLSAQTAQEAFALLRENAVDYIISSKELDKSTGEEFIKELNMSPHKEIPVIVISSDESQATQERFYALGIINYLQKSEVTVDRLSRYLDQVLDNNPIMEDLKKASFAVVDDSQVSLSAVTNILNHQGIKNVSTFSSPLDLLKDPRTFDVYFVDIILPHMSGEELVLELRQRHPHSIIFAISAISNIKTIIHILGSGADDFIIKPFEAPLAMARLKNSFKTMKTLQLLAAQKEELQRLATHDGLTGAFNHRWVLERLEEEREKAKRYHRRLTILIIDIDNFKTVNDTHAHLFGDAILLRFVHLVHKEIRESDILGRYGGDEFLLVMPETGQDEGAIIANRVRDSLGKAVFEGLTKPVTLSGGVLEYDGQGVTDMIREADERLYRAKNQGRNQIVAE